jgi:hypothetical protein
MYIHKYTHELSWSKALNLFVGYSVYGNAKRSVIEVAHCKYGNQDIWINPPSIPFSNANPPANRPKAQEQKPKQGQNGKGKPQAPKKGTMLTQHTGLPPVLFQYDIQMVINAKQQLNPLLN